MKPARIVRPFALVLAGLLTGLAGPAPGRSSAAPDLAPPYAARIGREYRTEVPLYLFESVAEPHFFYLGISGRGFARRPADLPATVERRYRGADCGAGIIRDIVPAGARLRILGETHDVSRPSGALIGFLCRLRYGPREVGIVNAEYIQTTARVADGRANPDIDPRIALPLPP